jgi:hypothetical protein
MKLITETIENVKALVESSETGQKNYFIEGIMMQAETVNRNGRRYSVNILENECKRYLKEYVNKKRALGELNHPSGPTVNLDRVSHMIVELNQDGNNFYGKAKVLDTPMGKIVKSLIDEGALLGVSSRGMGSLKKVNEINEVQSDFTLSAIDIVSDPSAPQAFVNGILEGKEWVWDNGLLKEQEIEKFHKEIKKISAKDYENKALEIFERFMRGI